MCLRLLRPGGGAPPVLPLTVMERGFLKTKPLCSMATTLTRCAPDDIAREVLSCAPATLNCFTPSTHICIHTTGLVSLAAALIFTGEATVDPLAGEHTVMVWLGPAPA